MTYVLIAHGQYKPFIAGLINPQCECTQHVVLGWCTYIHTYVRMYVRTYVRQVLWLDFFLLTEPYWKCIWWSETLYKPTTSCLTHFFTTYVATILLMAFNSNTPENCKTYIKKRWVYIPTMWDQQWNLSSCLLACLLVCLSQALIWLSTNQKYIKSH